MEALKYINYAKEKEAKTLRRNQMNQEHQFKISVVQQRKEIMRKEREAMFKKLMEEKRQKDLAYGLTV